MPNLDRDFYLDKQGLRQLINELETNIVALEYDTSVSYSVGDYCVYENNLYRCITATTGVWDSTDWVKVVISDEIPNIKSITTAQWEALTPAQKASGDYVITDAVTVPLTAENVPYDDTVSGLTADNVQDAIDELSQSSGASSVAQLEDVQLNNLSDNDLLVYDSNLSGGKLWKNAKKIVTCTKAQFDDWVANNSFPYTDCKYIVTDVNNINNPTAAEIPYDSNNTASVKDVLDLLLDRIYPIGSIYMSVTDSTVEAVQAKFGGTWVRFAEGTTLISANTTYPINTTGGSSTHQHKYGYQYAGYYREVLMEQVADAGVLNYSDATNYTIAAQTTTIPASSATALAVNSSTTGAISSTDKQANRYASIGNTGTSSTLPPYTTVYMYKRTA